MILEISFQIKLFHFKILGLCQDNVDYCGTYTKEEIQHHLFICFIYFFQIVFLFFHLSLRCALLPIFSMLPKTIARTVQIGIVVIKHIIDFTIDAIILFPVIIVLANRIVRLKANTSYKNIVILRVENKSTIIFAILYFSRCSNTLLKHGIISTIIVIITIENTKKVILGGNLLCCISIDCPIKWSAIIITAPIEAISTKPLRKRFCFEAIIISL